MQTVLQFDSWNDLGKDSSIKILVKYGALIGSKDINGLTPRDIATKKGTYSVFKFRIYFSFHVGVDRVE